MTATISLPDKTCGHHWPSWRFGLLCGVFLLLALCQTKAHAQLCTVSAIAPIFGNYQSSGNSANGSVNVTCVVLGLIPQNVVYTVQMEFSSQAQLTQRRMAFGSNYLNYNIFCEGSYAQIWGDGSGSTCVSTGSHTGLLGNLLTVYPVYGRIPGGQFLSPGTYTDTIQVKVLF